MLKAHQACIDLEKNVLRIQGREVKFLAEHELPDKARMFDAGQHGDEPQAGPSTATAGPSSSTPRPNAPFTGAGHTLGAAPSAGPAGGIGRGQGAPSVGASRFPEEAIETLIGLGASREVAIRSLEAAGGNVEIAASLLF